MPKFSLLRLFQSVSLLGLTCGLASFIVRQPQGPWTIVVVLVLPFLLGASIGILYDQPVFGGTLAVIATFPIFCFLWLLSNVLNAL